MEFLAWGSGHPPDPIWRAGGRAGRCLQPCLPSGGPPHLSHACRPHHVPLQHVSSELCGTSSAFAGRETKTDPGAHPEPCFLLSETPWQRAKRSPNRSWLPQDRQEGGKISSNVFFLIWAKNTSLWSILSLNSYHYQ